jgi:hypothetical protein
MSTKTARVTLELTVFDALALFNAARTRAKADKLDVRDWLETRRAHPAGQIAADIIMLLDPGMSPPGLQIEDSHAEVDA